MDGRGMVQGRWEQEVHGGLGVQGVAAPWRRLQPTTKQRGGAEGIVNAAGTSSKVGEAGLAGGDGCQQSREGRRPSGGA